MAMPRAAKSALRVSLVLAAVLFIGWLVLSPLYDDELPRVQANEGPLAVAQLMEAERYFLHDHGRLPAPGELDRSLLQPQPHVANIEFLEAGALRITFKGRREINGKTLTLTPEAAASGELQWRCSLPDIKPRWWPDFCRPKNP